MSITIFLTTYLGFVKLGIFGSANAHIPGSLCQWLFFVEYLIEHVTIGHHHVEFLFSTTIFYRGVPDFATEWHCDVACRGWPPACHSMFEKLVSYNSCFAYEVKYSRNFSICALFE